MSLEFTYDDGGSGGGDELSAYVKPSTISVPSRAEMGDTGNGVIPLDDMAGTVEIVGHQPFIVEESACSQPRLFTGWVVERDYGRQGEGGLIVEASRLAEVNIVDANAAAGFRIIWDTDGDQPEETWNDRLAWIVGSDYLGPLIGGDTTFFGSYTQTMDAADYRGSTAGSVLDDLCERTGGVLNWFIFWNPATSSLELFIKREQYDIGQCTLSISNVETDVDGSTVFAADMEAKLAREPDQTYSGVIVEYNGGKVYCNLASTAATYIQRETTINRPYTKRESTAIAQGTQWLQDHAVERDRITCIMRSVPAASVGLIQAGMGMDVKFSHFAVEGYAADFVTMRIVMCSPVPVSDIGDLYDVSLELVGPRPSVEPVCSYVAPTNTPPTNSSLDVFGNYFAPGYLVNLGLPPYAVTETTEYDPGAFAAMFTPTFYGTANETQYWGISPGVSVMETVVQFHWVWDLAALGTPELCAVAMMRYGEGYNDEAEHIRISYSDNGSAWTVVAEELGTDYPQPTPPYLIDETHRYWRFTYYFETAAGSNYFPGVSMVGVLMWKMTGGGGTVMSTVIPTTGGTTSVHTTDPTVDDDAAHGYTVGDLWVNTTDGSQWVLVDSTTGAAVWVSTTYVSLWNFATSDGVTTVDPTTELTFVGATLADLGSGVAEVTMTGANAVTNIDGGKEVVNTVAASGATETLDLGDGNVHDVTLTADCTLTFAGATAGVACSFTLLLRQDGTGGWTTTWPGSVIWAGGTAPTLDETASTTAVLTFFTLDGGTNWYGFPTGGGGDAGHDGHGRDDLGITPAVGSDTEYARQDHTHGTPAQPAAGGVGAILISDTPSTPLVFADLMQNEAQDDLMYADP